MGQLIIFEGLDGSGKGTQTKLTAQRLKEQGRDLRQITFPDYNSESSALVKMYLAGAFGDKPDDVNAYAASSFYAVDRFASYKTDWASSTVRAGWCCPTGTRRPTPCTSARSCRRCTGTAF